MSLDSNANPSGRLRTVALAALAFLAGAIGPARAGTASDHWAFQPVRLPALPAVRDPGWCRQPLDRFVLRKLEREKIATSPQADRPTLLRRLSIDLAGLPPTPAEIDAFANDPDPAAWEHQVDRLLASPRFGERWGRHWLDLARYADSSGYQVDRERPWAWVYRQWVVDSINRDQPFDEFTVWQLAGDLVGKDPRDGGPGPVIAAGFHRMALSNHEDGVDAREFAARALVDRVSTTGTAWLGLTVGCAECHSHKYDPISQREFYQLYAFFQGADEADRTVAPGTTAYTFAQKTQPPPTHVHVRGDFLREGERVEPGVPACLGNRPAAPTNRLDLARWIASPANPLTARVAVNQAWLHLFGRGLVATTEDFGTRGETPSHPELLDWLAATFVRDGWSRKALVRGIVLSATYRQSSRHRPELGDRDPENRWLARQARVRVESEVLRDAALAVAGRLDLRLGGPSFRPHMPEELRFLGTAGAWTWTDDTGPVLFRRSLYMYAQRTVPHPLLPTFDQADPSAPCTRRERSNTPLQALTLQNNPVFVEAARALADAAIRGCPDDGARAEWAFRRCVGRMPTATERARLRKLETDASRADPGNGMFVVAQTLLNLDEFQCRE